MYDWKENLLAFVGAAVLGVLVALVSWLALHFITWTPLSGIPWLGIRAGFVIGAVAGASAIMADH